MPESKSVALLFWLVYRSLTNWRNAKTVHSTGYIREEPFAVVSQKENFKFVFQKINRINSHEKRCFNQARATKLLRVDEFQEIVSMTHQNTDD